jgi:hypothetical protein
MSESMGGSGSGTDAVQPVVVDAAFVEQSSARRHR